MKWGGVRRKLRNRSRHLYGHQPPYLQPFDISFLLNQAYLVGIVLGQQGMTKRSRKDRVVAVRRHTAETDRDLKPSSSMSLCDLCDDFKISHSFDNVIYNSEIVSVFFSTCEAS